MGGQIIIHYITSISWLVMHEKIVKKNKYIGKHAIQKKLQEKILW